MQRREFLRTGLLGAVGLLPGVNLTHSWFDNALPITGSALLTTGKVSEVVDPIRVARNCVRYFYRIERNGKRTSRIGQHDPPSGTPPIWVAAVREDWNTLKRCLDDDPSLMSVTGAVHIAGGFYFHKDLPLTHVIATWSDNGRALRYLTSMGADVNTYHRVGTPLHFVIRWTQSVDAVRHLISRGANVTATNNLMRTPLHLAAGCNPNVEVAKYLVEHGADIRAVDNRGLTPLDVSFRYAKSEAVGIYFLDLMMGSKGREVTDLGELAAIKRRMSGGNKHD